MNQNFRYIGMIAALALFVIVSLTVLFPGGKWRWAKERQSSMTEETVVLPLPPKALPKPPPMPPPVPETTPSGMAKETQKTEALPSKPETPTPQPIPTRPFPIEAHYRLVVFAGGSVIERNESISTNSTRLKTLGFTVQYDGPSPRPDNVRVEWWVSLATTPVLTSPERVQDGTFPSVPETTLSADRWSSFDYPAGSKALGSLEHYDNKPVPGSYEVRLLINDRAMQAMVFKIIAN